MFIFTEWPCETVSETIRAAEHPKQADEEQARIQDEGPPQPCSAKCVVRNLVITSLRLFFILAGISLQLVTCFRRDLVSTDLMQIPDTNTTRLTCDNKNRIICALMIPDIVIFLLAIWLYVGLKFGHRISQCCLWLEFKEVSTIMEADTAANLNELVRAIEPKLSKRLILVYTIIPLCYITLSQLVSIGYLFAFQLVNEDVVIRTPFGGYDLAGGVKNWLIALTFIGFIALDLLYITVEMRYVYRCQMIIYYLQLMEHRARQETHEQFMEGVKTARRFIKYLNASSGTIGFITIIAVFQAANCAFILLSDDEITYPEAGAVTARLILFGFLSIYPFHKAAGLNSAIRELRDIGLATEIPSQRFTDNPQDQRNALKRPNEGFLITLRATMFGITVRPWLPYLVIFFMLLTLMIGSKFDNLYKIKV